MEAIIIIMEVTARQTETVVHQENVVINMEVINVSSHTFMVDLSI